MQVLKRDFKTKEYGSYNIPNDRHTPLLEELDNRVNCASCGAFVIFGYCYTSRTIHTPIGLGYPVCEKCYAKEREEELASEKSK